MSENKCERGKRNSNEVADCAHLRNSTHFHLTPLNVTLHSMLNPLRVTLASMFFLEQNNLDRPACFPDFLVDVSCEIMEHKHSSALDLLAKSKQPRISCLDCRLTFNDVKALHRHRVKCPFD